MFDPKWTLQKMEQLMSYSKLPLKKYHYGFFSSSGIGTKLTTFYHHTLKYHNT
jgi:hypothetical protein